VSIERKKRDNSNVSAEIERVVPKKVEFFYYPLLDFSACSASKMQRDLRGQIRVGWSGKSWERQAK